MFASSQILIRNRATELDARMNDGTTPLVLAARLAVEGMVEELIHCHADINAVDDHGQEITCFFFSLGVDVRMYVKKQDH